MAIATGQQILAADFIATSTGAGDAGKGVKLDASGLVAKNMLTRTATFAVAASDTLRNSNDAVKSTDLLVYTKIKEMKLNANLAGVRIKFYLVCSGDPIGAYAKIYKNGAPIGTERSTVGNETFSEDFAGFVTNDLIQIYAHGSFVDNFPDPNFASAAEVNNMRFYYSRYVTQILEETLSASLPVTTDPTISVTHQDPA